MAQYWLLDWMDAEGVKNMEDASRVVLNPPSISRLFDRAAIQEDRALEPLSEVYEQIVAGAGLDLTGQFNCARGVCMIDRVDHLVRRTWHYFDSVLVTGLDPLRITLPSEEGFSLSMLQRSLLNHMQVALYVRDSGLGGYLVFASKPPYCEAHLDEHSREVGLAPISDSAKEFAKILRNGVKMEDHGVKDGKRIVVVKHPALDTIQEIKLDLRERIHSKKATNKWASDYARHYAAYHVGDVTLARANNAALGELGIVRDSAIPKVSPRPTVADAAFNMSLPFIDSLSVKELLAIRSHEAADFQAFRSALKSAIKTRVDSMSEDDSGRMAQSVIDDVLEPALIDMDRKLIRAGEALAKRSAAVVVVGSVLTTVGLLAFAPLVAPGIIVGAGGLVTNINDYLKDRKEVKLSDMYFLWRLSDRFAKHSKRT